MHYTVILTRPASRDTLSHLPAPGLRQAGRMGEGRSEGSAQRIRPTLQQHPGGFLLKQAGDRR